MRSYLPLLAIFVLSQARSPKTWEQKQKLYETFPQLKSNNQTGCTRDMASMVMNLYEEPYYQVYQATFDNLNNLGFKEVCQNTGGFGEYLLFTINITDFPVTPHQGLCLPKSCVADDFLVQSETFPYTGGLLSNPIKSIKRSIKQAKAGFEIQPNQFLDKKINMTFSILQPDHMNQVTKNSTMPGMIIVLILFGTLAIAIIASTFKQWKLQKQVSQRLNGDRTLGMMASTPITSFNASGMQATRSTAIGSNIALSQDLGSPTHSEINNNQQLIIEEQPKDKSKWFEIFSVQNAYGQWSSPRQKEWEGKELQSIEMFRLLFALWVQTNALAMIGIFLGINNVGIAFALLGTALFTFVLSGIIFTEAFFVISAFLAFYKISQIYDLNDRLSFKDILKIYGNRLLKILPMYYIIFLAGWALLPWMVANSPSSFQASEVAFGTCDNNWWSTILLIGNLVPWEQNPAKGCFNWAWFLECDMQLFLFVPFFVILHKKSKVVSTILHTVLIFVGLILIYYISYDLSLTAAFQSVHNYDMYQYFIIKPYTKIASFSMGIMLSMLYLEIIDYRKDPAAHPALVFLRKQIYIPYACVGVGIGLLATSMFLSYSANAHPETWTLQSDNSLYFAFSRGINALGLCLILFSLFLQESTSAGNANRYFNAIGRLTYSFYLICYMMLIVFIAGMETGFSLTTLNALELGNGNYGVVMIFCVGIYLFIEIPVTNIVNKTLRWRVSHDDHLRQKFLLSKGKTVE